MSLNRIAASVRYRTKLAASFVFYFIGYWFQFRWNRQRSMKIDPDIWTAYAKRHFCIVVPDPRHADKEERAGRKALKEKFGKNSEGSFFQISENIILRLPPYENAVDVVWPDIVDILSENHYEFNQAALKPGDIVLDCGANIGTFALFAVPRVTPGGHLLCIEPEQATREILRANLSQFPSQAYSITERPVYKKEQAMQLTVRRDVFTGHALTRDASPMDYPTEQVITITIDELMRLQKIPRVDFIKMDIEGAEVDALLGARETLRRWKPRLAISAYHTLRHFYEIPRVIHEINPSYHTHTRFVAGTMTYAW